MSKTTGIAKKLREIYDKDPSIFDKCSVEEILQMVTSEFIPIDEPDEMFDEDPVEMSRYGYHGGYRDE